jgi:hypothetical protein
LLIQRPDRSRPAVAELEAGDGSNRCASHREQIKEGPTIVALADGRIAPIFAAFIQGLS